MAMATNALTPFQVVARRMIERRPQTTSEIVTEWYGVSGRVSAECRRKEMPSFRRQLENLGSRFDRGFWCAE